MITRLAATWAGAHEQVTKAGSIAWGTSNMTLPQMVGRLINVALSFLGLIFLGYALYAGFKWMTAQGDEKQVTEAKNTIKNVVIGMIILVAAYLLTTFVMKQLETIVTDAPPAQANGLTPVGNNVV